MKVSTECLMAMPCLYMLIKPYMAETGVQSYHCLLILIIRTCMVMTTPQDLGKHVSSLVLALIKKLFQDK